MPDIVPKLTNKIRLSSVGTTGLRETGGFVHEEFLIRLRGRNGVKLYEEMGANNAVVGTIMHITDMIVRQAEWRVKTPKGMEDNPAAVREKEFIEGAMSDMSHTWADFISESMSMLQFGWAYFETVYKIRKGDTNDSKTNSQFNDGRWGWRKFEIRAQDTLWKWLFDDEGGLDGMMQMDNYRPVSGPVVIPIEKALLLRTKSTKNNPEGRSLLRPAVRSWHFVKTLQETEAIGIQRDLTGMPIMEVPAELLLEDASAGDKALRSQLETMIQQIRVDERWGGLLPSELDKEGKPTGFKFRLQTTGGRRMMPTNDVIKRYESRIAMVWLAEFIMIGMDRVGTQGADTSKKDMFKLALQTILTDMIAEPFNKFGIGRLMRLNRVPRELWPKVEPGKLESPALDALGKFISDLAGAGLLSPNRDLESTLLSLAKLPTPPDDEIAALDDPTIPTPRDSVDQAAGVLSQSQIDSIMALNRAIKKREITRDVALELAGQVLNMEPSATDRFLVAEPEKLLPPPLPPAVVPTSPAIPGDEPQDPDPRG